MYRIVVHTPEFKGLAKVQQHKQITELLKNDIKSMHGLVIETRDS
jgi:stress-induced morphogen